jgi:hypothetical protein
MERTPAQPTQPKTGFDPTSEKQSTQTSVITLPQLQLVEAEWISNEHDEFIKAIQRYRSLYLTAIFIAFGWALGQVLGSAPTTLDTLRSRPDVAAVLSILPLISVLLAMLMLEAHAHAADLARYRYLLGRELGGGDPAWRWNLWRERHKQSILRRPTMVLNILSAVLFFFLNATALWFSYPALGTSKRLWVLWGPSLVVFVGLIAAATIVGIYWLTGKPVVTRAPADAEEWEKLSDD